LALIGLWRFPLVLAIPWVFLFFSTIRNLLFHFPREIVIEPRPQGAAPAEVQVFLDLYEGLGFQPVGLPLRIGKEPMGDQWSFAHPATQVTGTVFCTNAVPRKVGFDLISALDGGRGRLVSVADWMGATLPLPPGVFKQLLRGATPRDLLEFHLASKRLLTARGLRFETSIPANVAERTRTALAEYRQAILANVARSAIGTIWWVANKKSPYDGSIETQKGFEKTLRALGLT
jgi:hypothetical protein